MNHCHHTRSYVLSFEASAVLECASVSELHCKSSEVVRNSSPKRAVHWSSVARKVSWFLSPAHNRYWVRFRTQKALSNFCCSQILSIHFCGCNLVCLKDKISELQNKMKLSQAVRADIYQAVVESSPANRATLNHRRRQNTGYNNTMVWAGGPSAVCLTKPWPAWGDSCCFSLSNVSFANGGSEKVAIRLPYVMSPSV